VSERQDCHEHEAPHTRLPEQRAAQVPAEELAGRSGTWPSVCARHLACTVWTYMWVNTLGEQTAAGVGEGYYNRDKLPHTITSS